MLTAESLIMKRSAITGPFAFRNSFGGIFKSRGLWGVAHWDAPSQSVLDGLMRPFPSTIIDDVEV